MSAHRFQPLTAIKPLSLAVSSLILAACSSAPTIDTQRPSTATISRSNPLDQRASTPVSVQENAALLDMGSLDELEGLLEATDMTMVENNALLVQRYGNLWDRMRANFKMNNATYDPRIEAQKSWFISRQDYLNRLTARASRYLYHTVREAERRNIPTELALLPVIESSYDPNANSNAAAAGLWQFIPSTGRIYGLNQTPTFDGRRDVIESTRAAYDFLTTLYNQFGSWELALAAYNAGPGRIQSAINYNESRGLPTDYWSLRLPTETMNYVPRFMAVAQIVKNPSAYGVYLPAIANRQHFRSVPANVGVSLNEVSGLTGVGYDELRALNPALTAGMVDVSGPSRILIPSDVNETVDKKITQLRGNGFMGSPTYTANNTYVVPTTTFPQAYPSTSYPAASTGSGDSLTAAKQVFNKKETTALPSSSGDLAAMANSMVKNQTSTYVAPVATPTLPNSEPPLTAAEQRQITAQMQSENTLPTTSAAVTANNTIVQEPPLSQAERDSIAKQIEQTAPQVQQAINPTDGNIKLDAIQTQQSILEAKGETKKLTYEEPPVDMSKIKSVTPVSGSATLPAAQIPKATSQNSAPVKKPRPTGTRTTYQVKRGDTLASIATRMGVSWRDIAEWNQIDPNKALLAGSTLYLYNAKPVAEAKPIVKPTRPDSYVVQSGDTLTGIAAKFDLSLSELAKYNNIPTDYQVRSKQTLWLIPDKVPSKVVTAPKPAPATKGTSYTVKSGDSLGSIANDFDVSLSELANANGLSTTSGVRINQKLVIPKSATSKANSDTAEKSDSRTVKATSGYKGATQLYKVQPGDSLGSLADTFNISVSDLAALNYFKPTAGLIIGETIKVPKVAKAAPAPTKDDSKPTKAAPKAKTTTYKVKAGDSLIGLAKKYGLTPKELAGMNNMTATTQLKTGQTLTVPNQ